MFWLPINPINFKLPFDSPCIGIRYRESDELFPKRNPIRPPPTTLITPKTEAEPEFPSVRVTPQPGIVVKTKNVSGQKVFINLCKIAEIPPPPPLAEDDLKRLIAAENYDDFNYRVPMSLGTPRTENDKSGNPSLVADVAVNASWFEEPMKESVAFTTFVVNVAFEGLCDKYGDDLNLDRQNWVILRNRKYVGELKRHDIQKRNSAKQKIEEVTEIRRKRKKRPELQMFVEENGDFIAKIFLPGMRNSQNATLDVGEDRIVFEAPDYALDVFIPVNLDTSASVFAEFDVKTTCLTIKTKSIQ